MYKRRKLFIFIAAICICLCAVPFIFVKTSAKGSSGISIEAKTGIDGSYISGREIPVFVTVKSESDFAGSCKLIVRSDHTISIEKKLNIAAGESKELIYYVTGDNNNIKYYIHIEDEKGNTVEKKNFEVEGRYVSGAQIGIITDKVLNSYKTYQGEMAVCILKNEEIPMDPAALGYFDAIIADGTDLNKLSNLQISALTEYVEDGGNLVLMTGADYQSTIYAFPADFISGKINGLKEYDIESDKVTAADFDLEGFTANSYYLDHPLFYEKEVGYGKVMVSPISLFLSPVANSVLSDLLYDSILANLSTPVVERLNRENSGNNYYYLYRTLESDYVNEKPNVFLYMIVLLVYVLLVGPVLYIILKRMDKRQYTWVIVPAEALVFAVIIFFMGMSTRITEPEVTYFTMLNVREGYAEENTIFTVMAPFNRTYSLVTEGDHIIKPDSIDGWYGNESMIMPPEVNIAESTNGTTVTFENPSTFESFRLLASDRYDLDGTFDYEFKSENGRVTGYFTNDYDYVLTHVIGVHNGLVFYIAPEVGPGETVTFDTDTAVTNYVSASNYIEYTSFFDDVFGPEYYRNNEYERARNAITCAFQNRGGYNIGDSSMFIAITTDPDIKTFAGNCEMKNSGSTVMLFDADSKPDTGERVSMSIDKYITFASNGNTDLTWSRYMNNEDIMIEYVFPEPIKKILYKEELNPEFTFRGYEEFEGVVSFYNFNTGDYDEIFKSGVEGEIADLAPYLNEDNMLRVMYTMDRVDGQSDYYNITLPYLSAVFVN